MIHNYKIIVAFLIALAGCSHTTYHKKSNITKKEVDIISVRESVVILHVVDQDDVKLSATGFAYDQDRIATAAHFCVEAIKLKISHNYKVNAIQKIDGNINKLEDLGVDKISEEADVCLLKSEDHGLPILKVLREPNKISHMDKVTIVGAPIGITIGYFEGDILELCYRGIGPTSMQGSIIVSAPSTGGVSGSPIILNKTREVIGVLVMGHKTFDHFSIGVPISKVIELAE